MPNIDLELTALLRWINVVWDRAGQKQPTGLFPTPKLSDIDTLRVALAARLAAGTKGVEQSKNPSALVSIFDGVALNGKPTTKSAKTHYLPVQQTSIKTPAYPLDKSPDNAQLVIAYRKLCDGLTADAKTLLPMYAQHPGAYLEGLYLLLGKYTAQVVASPTLPDVSLFDLNHVSAAIVSCLRAVTDGEIKRWADLRDEALFGATTALAALVGGDVSGVQEYIYGITDHDSATRALRGRSFYLQLLTDAAARKTLRTFDLPITSFIYGGGAHFFILAPYQVVTDKFAELQRELSRVIFEAHGHALYLAMGCTSITLADFAIGKMSARWTALHGEFRQAKNRRYVEFSGTPEWGMFFAPQPHRAPDFTLDIERGSALVHAQTVAYGIVPFGSNGDALAALGLRVALNDPDESLSDAEYIVQYSFSDAAPHPVTLHNIAVVQGTRYTLNLVPDRATFDELAELPAWVDPDHKPHGIQRLGVLRMDVDNLGSIFQTGLGKQATLARLTALSRTLATFFEGRVAELCQHIETTYKVVNSTYKDRVIYGVYAGGDDVFLVGAWHLMPQIGALIRTEFGLLTGQHPDLTLSAGVALVSQKYPLYRAAADAHDALDNAKGYESKALDRKKDAISFLEEVYPWRAADWQGFTYVQQWAITLIDAGKTHERAFPMALLGVLMSLEMTRRIEHKADPAAKVGSYVWTGVYQLYRMRDQYKKKEQLEIQQLIVSIINELQGTYFERLPALGVAARWAHLTLRRSSEV